MLRFLLDLGRGVVASIARGEYDFEQDCARVASLPDDPAEWAVEELDLSIPTTRWLVYQVGAHSARDLIELLDGDLEDAPGYDLSKRLEIQGALCKVGLRVNDADLGSGEMGVLGWDDWPLGPAKPTVWSFPAASTSSTRA